MQAKGLSRVFSNTTVRKHQFFGAQPSLWSTSHRGSNGKEFVCNAGDLGSVPGSGRSPEEGNGYPLQYSCLENPRDGRAWWAAIYGVTQSRTQLKRLSSSSSSMYGCESWTIKKAEPRRIDAFELWCWRRLLRVPWTARRLVLGVHRKD